jgi:hypothetical protein
MMEVIFELLYRRMVRILAGKTEGEAYSKLKRLS